VQDGLRVELPQHESRARRDFVDLRVRHDRRARGENSGDRRLEKPRRHADEWLAAGERALRRQQRPLVSA